MDFVNCHQCSAPTLKGNVIFTQLQIFSFKKCFISFLEWKSIREGFVKRMKSVSDHFNFHSELHSKKFSNISVFLLVYKTSKPSCLSKISCSFVLICSHFFVCWLCNIYSRLEHVPHELSRKFFFFCIWWCWVRHLFQFKIDLHKGTKNWISLVNLSSHIIWEIVKKTYIGKVCV